MIKEDKITAHKCSINHREQVLKSDICGCFYCLSIFQPKEITEWVDNWDENGEETQEGKTAICPKCGIDSVLGSGSGYPIEKEFLKRMKEHWFDK